MAMIIQSHWNLLYDTSNWALVKTNTSNGTCCEVRLNQKNKLIKRKFGVDSVTVNGSYSSLSDDKVTNFFNNEIKWLNILKDSRWISKTVDYNIDEQWIIQELL